MTPSLLTKFFASLFNSNDQTDILVDAIAAGELVNVGKVEKAMQICDRLISSSNWQVTRGATQAYVFVVRGLAHEKAQKKDLAINDFEEVTKIEPNNLLALEHLGNLFRENGRLAEAKACLDKTILLTPEKTYAMFVNRAAVSLKMNNPQSALEDCNEALKFKPDSVEAMLNAAIANFLLTNYPESLACSEKILQIDPNSLAALYHRAKAQHHLGNYSEALEDYTNAIEGGYTLNGIAYTMRALTTIKLNQFENALEDCDRMIAINPSSSLAWLTRGNILLKLKRYDDVVQSFQTALKYLHTPATKAACHVALSGTYAKIGDVQQALLHCELAVAEDSTCAGAYNNRAWIFAHLGKWNEALAEIEKAFVSPSPAEPATLLSTRGLIFYVLGRLDEAKKDFDEAVAKVPTIAEAYFFRALIWEKQGFFEKATEDRALAEKYEFKLPSFSTIVI